MNGFAIYWLLSAFVALVLLVGAEFWDSRTDDNYKGISLNNLLSMLLMIVVPFVNTGVAIGYAIYFFNAIGPKIVFFKRKPNAEQ